MAVSSSSTQKTLRIGLWGAPGSGKTTFLSALGIAAMRSERPLQVFGADEKSADFLINGTEAITHGRRFPASTTSFPELSFIVRLQTNVTSRRRFGRMTAEPVIAELNIEMLDTAGSLFSSTSDAAWHRNASQLLPEGDLIGRLAACDGIIYLFDPIQEQAKGSNYDYLADLLLQMSQRRLTSSQESRLPHYVAVCATKFDDPEVYKFAKRKGYRSFDPSDPLLLPRVSPDFAEQFFRELAEESRSKAPVAETLKRYFHGDRVRYFITSSIGFHVGRTASRFQEQDFQNATPDGRIRGPVYPINVVEPLVWLGDALARGER